MLLLIPLGAEREDAWLPKATLGLVALNVLAFLLTSGAELDKRSSELEEVAQVAAHSIRGLPVAAQERAKRYSSPLTFLEEDTLWAFEARSDLDRERLTACREDYRRLKSEHAFYRYGFVPGNPTLLRFLSHQFLHADFLHLLFNMLFLWTAGGLLETTLGTAGLVPFYLLAGIAAALSHGATHPGSAEPAIGASGAVAGLMGACLALHARHPLRLALVAGFGLAPRISLVSLPVAVVLGLWLLEQLFMAAFRSSALNIAFDAHLGGFAFGLLTALVLRLWQKLREASA